ncbi:hypothetical protein [Sphingopyxis granuli]|uniref:hypothetical protein n=1 Tax=Sphingopyxis granuli TaxID=267128 RepID=UPI0012E70061|nr:hypothetical protein [Sphingopyxis granuli]
MDKESKRQMRVAEAIMTEDREILRALASNELDEQLAVARAVMKKRQSALKKAVRTIT